MIVDGRPFAEYQKMNIPGGICCPNGELPLRIGAIAPDPKTQIVVNCAGRTRSIIGARDAASNGRAEPGVRAGERHAGLVPGRLAARAQRRSANIRRSRTRRRFSRNAAGAARLAAQSNGVPLIETAQAAQWLADEIAHHVPVRRPHAGGIRGRQPARRRACAGRPAGASTDQWVGTRGARILLADSEACAPSPMAIWLRQMGHDASVLVEGVSAKLAAPDGGKAEPAGTCHDLARRS